MATTNYLVEMKINGSCTTLFALDDMMVLFSKKKDAEACYNDMIKKVKEMYGEDVYWEEHIILTPLKVRTEPGFWNPRS